MPIRELPAHPNLEHLKKQARTLLRDALASEVSAQARFSDLQHHTDKPKIADALHVIAREYGFETWPVLKLHIEMSSADAVEVLIAAIKARRPHLVREALDPPPFAEIPHQRAVAKLRLRRAGDHRRGESNRTAKWSMRCLRSAPISTSALAGGPAASASSTPPTLNLRPISSPEAPRSIFTLPRASG